MGKASKTGAVRKRGKAVAKKAVRKTAKRPKRAAKPARKATKKTAKGKAASSKKKSGKKVPAKKAPPPPPPPPRFEVRALDPLRKCGPGTSVQLLYRIDETAGNGSTRTHHLVFYDRHGWYCEHGRDCPAVPHAQREARKFGLIAAPLPGPTQHGRMRA